PPVGAPGASSAPVGETVAQSGPGYAPAVTGLWVGALVAGRVGGARGHPVAARVDGQRALLTPPSARNPASGKLFRPVSRACPGGIFALKTGSWPWIGPVRRQRSGAAGALPSG